MCFVPGLSLFAASLSCVCHPLFLSYSLNKHASIIHSQVVPQLIAIDLPVVPHCLFRLIHMAASVLLYVHMVGHSWVLAVLRAAFIHGVVCTLGYEYVSRKLVRSFRSHQQHKESSAPNSNEKLLRVEGKTATNSVTEVVEGVHSSTNAPAASDSSGMCFQGCSVRRLGVCTRAATERDK